jgi:hypothetical protein
MNWYKKIVFPTLLSLVVLAACNEERLTFDGLAGEYTLEDIDGSAPPVVVDSTDVGMIEITGGLLTMLPAAEYIMRTDLRLTEFGFPDASVTDSTAWQTGEYSIDQDLLIMETTTQGEFLFGTVSGPSIRVAFPEDGDSGILITYLKSGEVFD